MTDRDVKFFVQDMLTAIADISDALADHSFDDFQVDDMRRKAVLHDFQVLGEAATRIPPEIRKLAPDIPWRRIVAMRNALIHGYFLVDLSIVFSTAKDDLPGVRLRLEELRDRLDAHD